MYFGGMPTESSFEASVLTLCLNIVVELKIGDKFSLIGRACDSRSRVHISIWNPDIGNNHFCSLHIPIPFLSLLALLLHLSIHAYLLVHHFLFCNVLRRISHFAPIHSISCSICFCQRLINFSRKLDRISTFPGYLKCFQTAHAQPRRH